MVSDVKSYSVQPLSLGVHTYYLIWVLKNESNLLIKSTSCFFCFFFNWVILPSLFVKPGQCVTPLSWVTGKNTANALCSLGYVSFRKPLLLSKCILGIWSFNMVYWDWFLGDMHRGRQGQRNWGTSSKMGSQRSFQINYFCRECSHP